MNQKDIFSLIEAALSHNQESFAQVAKRVAESEDQMNHRSVADRLRRLANRHNPGMSLRKLPSTTPPFLEAVIPERRLNSIVLSDSIQKQVERLVEDYRYREAFRENNIPFVNTYFLMGPSGCGKTSLSEAIATELDLPLARVCISTIIDSHMGSTSTNFNKIFRWASNNPCVLFIDEADSFCCQRTLGDGAVSETRRIVNSLLIELDKIAQTDAVVLFASNFHESIDEAVIRRVKVIEMEGVPSNEGRVLITNVLSDRFRFVEKSTIAAIAYDVKKNSYASIEAAVCEVARSQVVATAMGGKKVG